MSDQNINATFVGDTKIHAHVFDAAAHRDVAVAIALELIKSSCAGAGHISLNNAINNLPSYADKIQEALKTRD